MKLYYIYKLPHENMILFPSILNGLIYDIKFKGTHDKNRRFYLVSRNPISPEFSFFLSKNSSVSRPGILKFLGKHFISEISREKLDDMNSLFDIGYRDGTSWIFNFPREYVCYLISKIYKDELLSV